jgi:hypothetical protein
MRTRFESCTVCQLLVLRCLPKYLRGKFLDGRIKLEISCDILLLSFLNYTLHNYFTLFDAKYTLKLKKVYYLPNIRH